MSDVRPVLFGHLLLGTRFLAFARIDPVESHELAAIAFNSSAA